jgi:glyoxylase-like metal-dependent hydrolase (beta-lactamase superfamily II)
MALTGYQLKPNTKLASGRVRRFALPGKRIRITQITTFCPDIIGPGPTHIYLIETDSLVMFDIGIPTSLAKALFYSWRNQPIPKEVKKLPLDYSEQQLLEGLKIAGYSIDDIDLLIISHGHPDHFLSAHTIFHRKKPKIAAHILDAPEISSPWEMLRQWILLRQQMRGTGMPPPKSTDETLIRAVEGGAMGSSMKMDVPIFRNGPLKIDGSPISGIQTIHLPGHSPGSIGLIVGEEGEERVLLCGDVLLNPITPHPNDLLLYLRSLKELESLNKIALVLPAHQKAMRHLKARVEFLQAHHRRRLRATYEACYEPRCAWDIAIMPRYFDLYVDPLKFNPMAGREALVHMELLRMVEGLCRSHIQTGVHYFRNSGEPFEDVYARIMELVDDKAAKTIMRY